MQQEPVRSAEKPFFSKSSFIDDDTGFEYNISKIKASHVLAAQDDNPIICTIKLIHMCVRQDGQEMDIKDIMNLDYHVFSRIGHEINKILINKV